MRTGPSASATPDGGWETIFEQPPFDPLDAEDSIRLQAYANQLRDLMAAIAEGRDPFVSGRQGANTTSWLEAAERSAASGAERAPVADGPCVLTASGELLTAGRPSIGTHVHTTWPTIVEVRRPHRTSTTTSSSPASTRRTTCTGSTTSAGRPSSTGSAR